MLKTQDVLRVELFVSHLLYRSFHSLTTIVCNGPTVALSDTDDVLAMWKDTETKESYHL